MSPAGDPPSHSPRGRGRPRVYRTEDLLDSASEALVAHGYRGLTFAAVARHAGVPTASVQHHFTTVAELRRAALKHNVRVELDALRLGQDAATAPWDRVRTFIHESIGTDGTARQVGWTLWLDYYRAAANDPEIAEHMWATRMSWREVLAEVIRSGVETGVFAVADEPIDLAETLFALIDGFGVRLAVPHSDAEADRIIASIERACVSWLGLAES